MGEVGAVTAGVPSQQGQSCDGRMCADVEIGQRRTACPTLALVREKAFAGQKSGFPGKGSRRNESAGSTSSSSSMRSNPTETSA